MTARSRSGRKDCLLERNSQRGAYLRDFLSIEEVAIARSQSPWTARSRSKIYCVGPPSPCDHPRRTKARSLGRKPQRTFPNDSFDSATPILVDERHWPRSPLPTPRRPEAWREGRDGAGKEAAEEGGPRRGEGGPRRGEGRGDRGRDAQRLGKGGAGREATEERGPQRREGCPEVGQRLPDPLLEGLKPGGRDAAVQGRRRWRRASREGGRDATTEGGTPRGWARTEQGGRRRRREDR